MLSCFVFVGVVVLQGVNVQDIICEDQGANVDIT